MMEGSTATEHEKRGRNQTATQKNTAETSAAKEGHREEKPDNETQQEEQRGLSGSCLNFLRPCCSWCRATCEEEDKEKLSDVVPLFDSESLVDKAGPLVAGIPALLVFRDGHSQNCLLRLNRMRSAVLLLTGGRFGRTIPLEEIQTVLSGEELRRVDGFNADKTHCAAVSLISGFAIPLVFHTEEEKNSFIVSVTSLLGEEVNMANEAQESNNTATTPAT